MKIGDNVLLNCIEGFGGYGHIVDVREGPCPFKVLLNDGSQPASWFHAGEVETMQIAKPTRVDSRPATYEHIQAVRQRMHVVIVDLMRRAQHHDQSKLRSPEVEIFDEFTPKLAATTYGSHEYQSFLDAMKPALSHHYAYVDNRHHPEHFAFRADGSLDTGSVKDGSAIRSMNLLDVLEMICDWAAAAGRHANGDVKRSVEINQARFGYSDDFKAILLNTLPALAAAKASASSGGG